MSFLTDGAHTENNLPSATVWPGEVDNSLQKAFDVNYPSGPPIKLPDHDSGLVSLPQAGESFDDRRQPFVRLGDDTLFRNNTMLTKHLYNAASESIPNKTLLSVRNWR
jgi:hypothetical protein